MKKWFVAFITFLSTFSIVFAQDDKGFNSVSEAGKLAKQILQAAGRSANFQIREANVPNAVAVLTNGKRYILYNPDFIDKLTRLTGTKWAAISVLAHEIGHHLETHVENGKIVPMSTELEADEFSGFVLKKMGASLEEAQAAMKTLASNRATRTHPARDDRLESIEYGWAKASGDPEAIAGAKQRQDETVSDPILNLPKIIADIHFNTDPGVAYHVTSRNNVVRIKDDQIEVIGKLTRTSDSDFPFVIYDNNTKVFINTAGELISERGKSVGKITTHRS